MRNADIAYEWRRQVLSEHRWTECETQTSEKGICGGFEAESDQLPRRRVYLKPLRPGRYPTAGVAAREKIAADLAHDLDVAVPPVLLHRRLDAGDGDERCCALSLIMYPTQWHWGVLKRAGHPGILALQKAIEEHAPHAAARALAFDTWVLQGDHDHEANSAFGYDWRDPARRGFVFFDYAYALAFQVPHGQIVNLFETQGQVKFPKEMLRVVSKPTLRECVNAVEGYPEVRLREIFERIPTDFLDPDESELIIRGMLSRRTRLRAVLNPYM